MEENRAEGVESSGSAAARVEPAGVAPEGAVQTPVAEPEPREPALPLPTPDSAPLAPGPRSLSPAEVIEALLFAADAPVKLDRLAELAEVPPEVARAAIDGINATYRETGRAFRVQRVAQGFQLYTMPASVASTSTSTPTGCRGPRSR